MHHKISSSSSVATLSAPSLLVLECFCLSSMLAEAPKPSGLILGYSEDSFFLKGYEHWSFWSKCFTNSMSFSQKDPSGGTMFEVGQWKWRNLTTCINRENMEATTAMMKRPPKLYTPRLGESVEISALPSTHVVWVSKYFLIIPVILSVSSVTFKTALEM